MIREYFSVAAFAAALTYFRIFCLLSLYKLCFITLIKFNGSTYLHKQEEFGILFGC